MKIAKCVIALLAAALVSGCGGGGSGTTSGVSGGSSGTPPPSNPPPSNPPPSNPPPSNPPPPNPPPPTAPAITSQPATVAVVAGSTATFTVVATGTDPLSYQWSKNGTAVAGATAASYTAPATQAADDRSTYSVVVSNSAGSVTSNGAVLKVSSPADVVTFKNDAARTGQYLVETTLTPANVNATSFGLLRNLMVDGKVDAQPLYLSQLTVGGSIHNVVYVATEHGSVYAFDADTGAQLWKVALLAAGEATSGNHGCGLVTPEIGITSTPVIDRVAGAHGTLYVLVMSLDSSSKYHQKLHALDVTTGAELLNGPTEIAATFPNLSGTSTFDPGQYVERAALLLANGLIYTSYASHCDSPPYGGWVIAFNQSDLSLASALNVAPNSGISQSGGNSSSINGPAIWMSGAGPASDSAGNVYILTGNGRFETTMDAHGFPNESDYGNSFVKIAKSGSTLGVGDYFTMFNEVTESLADLDLGSGGAMVLPDMTDSTNAVKHLVIGAGKDGVIYVVDRDNMGKFNSVQNNIWQEVDGALNGQVRSSPAYFNGNLYFGARYDTLKAFSITNAKVSAVPTSQSASSYAAPGTSPIVSANGTSSAIVWTHENQNTGAGAVLHAYDATNLSHALYNSTQAAGNRDQFGTGNKFITPTVAGGKVFVGTTNSVGVFGLLH